MHRKRFDSFDPTLLVTLILVAAALVALAFTLATPAQAASGGIGFDDGTSGKPQKAKLRKNGKAVPPANAPKAVVRAIRAANKIRRKPYRYGGGHAGFRDSGYDCSGAVSVALNGAGVLDSPLDSSGLARWGRKGKGRWITVYAHGGHAYAVIAGLRFDTSGPGERGPRWRKQKRSPKGFATRHWRGL